MVDPTMNLISGMYHKCERHHCTLRIPNNYSSFETFLNPHKKPNELQFFQKYGKIKGLGVKRLGKLNWELGFTSGHKIKGLLSSKQNVPLSINNPKKKKKRRLILMDEKNKKQEQDQDFLLLGLGLVK